MTQEEVMEQVREEMRSALLHLIIRDADAISADEAITKILSIPEIKKGLELYLEKIMRVW